MTGTGQKNPSKRKQQVRRYWVMIGLALVLCIGILGYHFLGGNQEKEAVAITQTKQQKELWEQARQEAGLSVETPEEHLEQVRVQATVQGYPKGVIELLDKNPATVNYVEAYGEKQGQIYAEDIGDDYVEGQIPLLIQWDERWGYTQYGDTYLGLSGCGPTVVSMAASYLLSDGTLTPNAVARFSEQNGYYVDGVGSSWSLIEEGLPQLGVRVQIGSLEEGAMAQVIERGGVILCSVGPGTFTDSGHFILLCGYAQGEGFLVHDPNSAVRSGRYYRFADLADEIVQLWFAYR